MRYYFPHYDDQHGWAVAYLNHRNQICPVLGGVGQLQAIYEAATMTANAQRQAQINAPVTSY